MFYIEHLKLKNLGINKHFQIIHLLNKIKMLALGKI